MTSKRTSVHNDNIQNINVEQLYLNDLVYMKYTPITYIDVGK